ncbi:hypothetical protein TEA_027563 [Camellia sinensis var. sinensis]|uniref:G domain-containing protein n=1 Tax=Camellia sinensis var. sinensis TaxID=542762 RepID=A0A4V3WR85_CAMSN|nr:hypothetical protein TEA_027563 [Camellia sinensis var. sinensis]
MASVLEEKNRAEKEIEVLNSRLTSYSSFGEALKKEIEEVNEEQVMVELAWIEAVKELGVIQAQRKEEEMKTSSMDFIKAALKRLYEETYKMKQAEKKADVNVRTLNSKLLRAKSILDAGKTLSSFPSSRRCSHFLLLVVALLWNSLQQLTTKPLAANAASRILVYVLFVAGSAESVITTSLLNLPTTVQSTQPPAQVRELKKTDHANHTITVLPVGIPNVGKSALANSLHHIGQISAAEIPNAEVRSKLALTDDKVETSVNSELDKRRKQYAIDHTQVLGRESVLSKAVEKKQDSANQFTQDGVEDDSGSASRGNWWQGLVTLAIVACLGALAHTLGILVPVIGASEFATAATAIGTVANSFR